MTYADCVCHALRYTNDLAEALIAAELAMSLAGSGGSLAPLAPLNAGGQPTLPSADIHFGYQNMADGSVVWAGETPPGNIGDWSPLPKGPKGGSFWRHRTQKTPQKGQIPVGKLVSSGPSGQQIPIGKLVSSTPSRQQPKPEVTQHAGAAPMSQHAAPVSQMMRQALAQNQSLDRVQKAKYQAAADNVLRAMPEKALQRLAKNIKKVSLFNTPEEVGAAYLKEAQAWNPNHPYTKQLEEKISRGVRIGGTFNTKTGEWRADGGIKHGGFMGGERSSEKEIDHVYAHELGHGVDGPRMELSNSPEWNAAWVNEIHGSRLSDYANTNAQEGLAEFARALYTGALDEETLNTFFPKSSKFFQQHGLMHPQTQR